MILFGCDLVRKFIIELISCNNFIPIVYDMSNNYFTQKSITNVFKNSNRLSKLNLAKLGLLSEELADIYKHEMLELKNAKKEFTQMYQIKVLEILHDIIHHQIAMNYHENRDRNVEKIRYGKNKQKLLIGELKNISKKGLEIGMGITQMPMWNYISRKDMKSFMNDIIQKKYNDDYIRNYAKKYLENIKKKMTTNNPNLNSNDIGFKFVKNRNSYNINLLNRDVLIYYDL